MACPVVAPAEVVMGFGAIADVLVQANILAPDTRPTQRSAACPSCILPGRKLCCIRKAFFILACSKKLQSRMAEVLLQGCPGRHQKPCCWSGHLHVALPQLEGGQAAAYLRAENRSERYTI